LSFRCLKTGHWPQWSNSLNNVPEETQLMRYLTQLILFGLFMATFALSGCSAGKKAFSKGESFEADGKYEEAMYSYAEAFKLAPEVGDYRARFFKARDKAAEKRFKLGMEQYDMGDYVGALAEFQTAYGLDSTQGRFKQKADETIRLRDGQLAYQEGRDFEKANKLKDANRAYAAALELHPVNKEYQEAFKRVSGQRRSKLEGFELSLKSSKPITLKFKDARIKDVFTIITQLTGISFIFDEGIKDQPISIYLENATFQQAMDLLTNMNKLGKKVLNETTVVIYPRSPDKIKQYEDLTIRTFHLSYMEAKKAVNLVRTLIQVKKIHVNEETNSLIVRDTTDIVDLVEKIIDANDVPDPEVILEVEVIEISDTNAKKLGLLLDPYSIQSGGYKNVGGTPTPLVSTLAQASTTLGTASTATVTETKNAAAVNLIKAFSKGPYSAFITVPNATYNFGKTLTDGEVLSNPKIRVKNKEKAKFNVGTRLPIVTTTLNGTVSQANVQYVDVGVKLNAEPTIQLNNEVVIKMSLEVSQQIGGTQTVSGASVVTIGTRNLDTVLSLKDGETSVIGGLREYRESNSKNTINVLGDIPLIGPFFSGYDNSKGKTELVLAITPHLVRSVTVPTGDLMSFNSGKEDDPSLSRPMASFDQEPVFEAPEKKPVAKKPAAVPQIKPMQPATAPVAAKPVVTAPATTAPATTAPATTAPATTAPATTAPATTAPATTAPATTAPVTTAPVTTAPVTTAPVTTAPVVAPPPAGDESLDAEAADAELTTATPVPVAQKPTEPAPAETVPATPEAPAVPPVPVVLPLAPPPPVKRGLLQLSSPASIGVGQQFYVDVKVADVQGLTGASYSLTYDPNLADLVSVSEGKFLKQGGQATTFSSNTAKGSVSIMQSRPATVAGANGVGSLASALFKTKNKGQASFGFQSVVFTAADGKPLEMLPFSTAVDVR
jgi:general secretion pathway protein D